MDPKNINKKIFKSQLPWNGPKFGDFVDIWYLKTQKNWGQDVSSLSGCKKNSHTWGVRVQMDLHGK